MKNRPGRPRRSGGAIWLLAFAVPAFLITLHTLYWQWISRALEDGLHAWTARRIAAGWRVASGSPIAGGWPLAATLTLSDPAIRVSDRSGWAGDRVVLQVSLLHPGQLLVDAPGAQLLTLPAGQIGFAADRLHLELPLAGRDAPAEFSVATTGISLPPSLALPLGSSIAALSASGRISHAPEFSDADIAAQAREWRDRGGSVDLRHFALLWGPLDLSGSAAVALDERLQPKGDAAVRVVGFADTIALLARAGSIQPQTAMLASAALAMLSDAPGTAQMPLHLEGGRVTLRQIPLASLPELAWPSR